MSSFFRKEKEGAFTMLMLSENIHTPISSRPVLWPIVALLLLLILLLEIFIFDTTLLA